MGDERIAEIFIEDEGRWSGVYFVRYLDPLERGRLMDRLTKRYRKKDAMEQAALVARDFCQKRITDWDLSYQPDLECTRENIFFMYKNLAGAEVLARVLREADERFKEEDGAIEKN